MKVTTLGLIAVLTFLIAGCGDGHTAASSAPYKTPPAVAPSSDAETFSTTAVAQAARTECAAGRRVATAVTALDSLPASEGEVQMDTQGPQWSRELSAGEVALGNPAIPDGPNKANIVSTALAKLAVDIDFADIDYDSGRHATAMKDDIRFIDALRSFVGKDCAN
jgi:hypothetical protein